MSDKEPLRLSLILSGAISLGAYEAGVVSQIAYALDKWNEQTSTPYAIVDLISGASAGAMTGAMLACHIMEGGDPDDFVRRNYYTWCGEEGKKGLTFAEMVQQSENDRHAFFSSSLITEVGERYFEPEPRTRDAKRIRQDELIFACTLTALDPIPFKFDVATAQTEQDEAVYKEFFGATRGDWVVFSVAKAGQEGGSAEIRELPPAANRNDAEAQTRKADWERVRSFALASGAFPFAWQPMVISRYNRDYPRPWREREGYVRMRYTDGGVLNNLPLHRAAEALEHMTERKPGERRAYVLIQPDPVRLEEGGEARLEMQPAHRDGDTPVTRLGSEVMDAVLEQSFFLDLNASQKVNRRLEARDAFLPRTMAAACVSIRDDELDKELDRVKDTLEKLLRDRGSQRKVPDVVDYYRKQVEADRNGKLGEAYRDIPAERRYLFLLQYACADYIAGLNDKHTVVVESIFPTDSRKLGGELLGHFGGFLAQDLMRWDFFRGVEDATNWLIRLARQERWPDPATVINTRDEYKFDSGAEKLAMLDWDRVPGEMKEKLSDLVLNRSVEFATDEFGLKGNYQDLLKIAAWFLDNLHLRFKENDD